MDVDALRWIARVAFTEEEYNGFLLGQKKVLFSKTQWKIKYY